MTREEAIKRVKGYLTDCLPDDCYGEVEEIIKALEQDAQPEHNPDDESKQLIDELSKMPPMVIATAYLYALNYTRYGEDVTREWLTATQNASALEKAYRKGYHDAMKYQFGQASETWKEGEAE